MKVTMEMTYFAYILYVELIFAHTMKVGYKKKGWVYVSTILVQATDKISVNY